MELNLYPSDKAKLLALPFFMQRRVQNPDPIKGTWQWDLFKEFSGNHWDDFDHWKYDPEDKFSEKDLPKGLREKVDQESPEFIKMIRKRFLLTSTRFERHKELQEEFRKLMPTLNELTEEEGYAFYHLISNGSSDDYIDRIHGGYVEEKLAKISEKTNFEAKNRHWLQKSKMEFLRPEKAPISKAKIKDVLNHSAEFKHRFNEDIGLYDTEEAPIEHEKKIIEHFYRMAKGGPLMKLRDEIGLKRDRPNLGFLRYGDYVKIKNTSKTDTILDNSYMYFFNSHFLPLDMLDYYDSYSGLGEFMPAHEIGFDPKVANMLISSKRDYDFTKDANGFEIEYQKPNFFFSESDEEEAAEEDDDDDDDEEGEGDDDEEKPKVYSDYPIYDERYPMEDEEIEWPVNQQKYHRLIRTDSPIYFDEFETIRERYNDMELEGFARLLDVKPFVNWQDGSKYMDRIGTSATEDFAQQVDPEHKMAGEVEREMFEKMIFAKHRHGSTVRFSVGDKRPKFMTSER